MTLFKRILRWVAWKRLSRQQRLFIAHIQSMALGNSDAWEVKQLRKEKR